MRILFFLAALCWATCASAQQFVSTGLPQSVARSEINLEIPHAYEYPFINNIKNTQVWWQDGSTGSIPATPAQVDVNGYPIYNSGSGHLGWSLSTGIPIQYSRPGNYVLTWTGFGDFEGIKETSNQAGGSYAMVAGKCVGSGTSGGGIVSCSNVACVAATGYIAGTTLTIVTNTNTSGCGFQQGEPVSSDTGNPFTVNTFGTPTIITSLNSNSGTCTGCTYTVNFSQTVGSSGSPVNIYPGGRLEFTTTGQAIYSNNISSTSFNVVNSIFNFNLRSTGTVGNQSQTAQNIALLFHCAGTGAGSCVVGSSDDDEQTYWGGTIVSPRLKTAIKAAGIGVVRDLGFTNNVFNNLSTWGTRKPSAYMSWGGIEMRCGQSCGNGSINYWVGNATQSAPTSVTFTGCINDGGACGDAVAGTTLQASSVTGTLAIGHVLDAAHVVGTIDNCTPSCGSGSNGNILNVTSVTDGTVALSQTVYDANGSFGTVTITGSAGNSATCGASACTGNGGTGTYLLSANRLVNSNSLLNSDGVNILNLTNVGVLPKSFISAFISGTGGAGTYKITIAGASNQYVASESMTAFSYKNTVNNDASPPADKETVLTGWATSSPNPSLNYYSADNGVTYKSILNSGGTFVSSNAVPVNSYVGTLVYDAAIGSWLHWGGFITNCCGKASGVGLTGYVPPEVFIELCSELGVNPWITELYMGSDPISDFTTQYAKYINTNFPAMVPEFETPDETWNGITDNSSYAAAKTNAWAAVDTAWASGITVFNDNYTGKVGSLLCQAVSAVYGAQSWRYRCIVGVNTNGEWGDLNSANLRLLSTAYVNQNAADIPTQSGCVGPGAIQTLCPTPFAKNAAYNWATTVTPQSYWNVAESGLINPTLALGGTLTELIDAYNYYNGSAATQATIMSNFLGSSLLATVQNTIGNFQVLYPFWNHYGVTCAGSGGFCPVTGIAAYEGGYSAPFQSYDFTQTVFTATGASPCILNTTKSYASAYIDDGLGGGVYDGVPGNTLSIGVALTNRSTNQYYGLNVAGSGVAANTVTNGLVYTTGNTNSAGAIIGISVTGAKQAVPATTITLSGNGVVQGMQIQMSNTTGFNGTYYVGASPTGSSFTIYTNSGLSTPLDCTASPSGFNNSTMDYVGSANWLNFLRENSYVAAGLATYQTQLYNLVYSFGGMGASQLNLSNPDSNGTGWSMNGNDIWGYWPLSLSSSATLSSGTLTIGGTIVGRFQVGQTLYGGGLPSQTYGGQAYTITACTLVGSSGPCGTNSGDQLTVSPSTSWTGSQSVNGVVYGNTNFPGITGAKAYNSLHGG